MPQGPQLLEPWIFTSEETAVQHLDEHNVPDLEDVGVVHVDERSRVPAADAVIVDLAARAAGALVTHLPEVVLAAERQHPRLRQQLQPGSHPEAQISISKV